jgi:hypothetical protein
MHLADPLLPTRVALPPLNDVLESAASEVHDLARQLEAVLDARHHAQVHRLRLAAETLGAMRAACHFQYPR